MLSRVVLFDMRMEMRMGEWCTIDESSDPRLEE